MNTNKTQSFVIVTPTSKESLDIGFRLKENGQKNGLDSIQLYMGYTPEKSSIQKLFLDEGISTTKFDNNKFSRRENSMCCFFSHYSLWKKLSTMPSDDDDAVFVIFEHDALFERPFDWETIQKTNKLCSIGRPSFGKYNKKSSDGVFPLYSKNYLPGAHAYILKKSGACELVEMAKKKDCAEPTDVFINKKRFPWIQEVSPWICYVDETFSTVQNVTGCKAKHAYDPATYRII